MKAILEKVPYGHESSFYTNIREEDVFEFNWHYHPEFELTYVQTGKGHRLVGDEIQDFNDHDMVLLGPNLPHTWSTMKNPHGLKSKAYVIQFKNELFTKSLLSNKEFSHIRQLLSLSTRGISFSKRIINEVSADIESMVHHSSFDKLLSLFKLLHTLGKSGDYHPITSNYYTSSLNSNNESRLDTVCRFINDHYADSISLEEIADMSHMTKTSFCRFFKKMTGKSFSDYLNDVRIAHVCTSLVDGKEGISQIAMACGFTSITHFNRMFSRKKGLSPSEFRRSHETTG